MIKEMNHEEVVVNKEFEKNLIEMIEHIDGFDAQDFTIQSQDEGKGSTLTITMNGTLFNFFASIPHKRYKIKGEYSYNDQFDFSINIECNPGEIVDHEMQDLIGRNQLLERIKTWLICLKKNIDSTYTHRKIEQQRELIEKLTEEIKTDNHFTFEEAEALKCKLEQQQKQIEDQLRKQIEEGKELEIKIKQLETDFKELEKRLFTQTKKGWIKSWLGRALKWGLDPVNQQSMIETTKNVKALITDGN